MSYYGNGIGEITGPRVALSTVIITGAAVSFAAGGVLQAWADGYFLGRAKKKGVTYKTLARRNAVLGGALGAVAAAGILSA
tara:strand:- start:829 stop:1071 length:243 start_codon:yes stop_codon:yes gene_type:complete